MSVLKSSRFQDNLPQNVKVYNRNFQNSNRGRNDSSGFESSSFMKTKVNDFRITRGGFDTNSHFSLLEDIDFRRNSMPMIFNRQSQNSTQMSNRVDPTQRYSFDTNAQKSHHVTHGGPIRLQQTDNCILQKMQEDQEQRMKTKIQQLKI